ncbi:MAG: ABC transporter permease [Terriglobia bacterium]|jgi:putative ABC transport system permease protein
MGNLLHDLRYGLRMLAKNPGFAAVSVLSLALGIGANTTIFSIVDKELLNPWPVKDPGRLAMITMDAPKLDFNSASYPDYLDIRNQVAAFSDVVAYGDRGCFLSVEGRGQGLEAIVEVVSQNYFDALGVRPILGRAFSLQASQAAAEGHSVVVSYNLWQKYFGGDPSLPGRTTLLDDKQFTVIGIAPQGFSGLRRASLDIWVTKEGWETMLPGEARSDAARDDRWFDVAGHLRRGTKIEEARAQLLTLAKRLASAYPSSNQGVNFITRPALELTPETAGAGLYFMIMVGLVLLISCANVANLLLAQTERRQREIAMRRAMGAGQRRLALQLLTEGLPLAVAGGALGTLLAAWLMKILPALVPGLSDTVLTLDGRVLLFTTAISLLSALVFGLVPSFWVSRSGLAPALKGDDPRLGRAMGRVPLRSLLVSGEIALSVVLLVASALLLRSLRYSQRINPGFDTNKNVVMLSVAPPQFYAYSDAQARAIYPELASRVGSLPGVIHASYARRPPLIDEEEGETLPVVIPGVQSPPGTEHFKIRYNIVGPKFFATVGARLKEGREFSDFDRPSTAPVVIINDAMARRFWPRQDPVGKALQIEKKNFQVVGVVEAGRYNRLHEVTQPYAFLPFTQAFSLECTLFVETAGDPREMLPAILKATTAVAKNLPIVNAVTFRESMREELAGERSVAELLGSLSILGMVLAAVGLYAAVAYLVNRRTRELGIRMALGARRGDVLKLVLWQGLRLSGAGAAVGLAGALAASRLMSGFIYGVAATDPLSYVASILAAMGVALAACYFPARRATKVDPLVALRYE